MITIAPGGFDDPDSQVLLAELAADLHRRYGGDSEPGPKPTAQDVAAFLVARDQAGAAVGCVGLVRRDRQVAEIKRMYVRPAVRGNGLGRRLLEAIEQQAMRLGASRIVVETGLAQPEAMRLYQSAGYEPIAPFGVYKDSPLSRCFARAVATTSVAIVAGPVTSELPSDFFNRSLAEVDPEIAEVLAAELERQQRTLEMIASENFVPQAVLECQGSVLTNKYAEGYPGRRYYGGCEHVDVSEQLAIDRAKALFGAEHANVQPHAGAQANAAVFAALLDPGDSFLGLALDHGGHLTHGRPANFSGKLYHPIPYHVREEDSIVDMDEVERLALEHRPKMILAGWSAYPRILDFARFRAIADEIGAVLFVDMAHFAGLVAAGLHPNPVPHAHVVSTTIHKTLGGPRSGMILCTEELAKPINSAVFPGQQGGPLEHVIAAKAVALKIAASGGFRERQERTLAGARAVAEQLLAAGHGVDVLTGGTDVHLVLVDLRETELDGQQAEDRLAAVGITVNRNAVPFDPRPPMVSSGLRVGTPALATRGLQVEDFVEVGRIMAEALTAEDFEARRLELAERAAAVAERYPLYQELAAPATL